MDSRVRFEEIQFHDYKHFLTDFRRKTALRVNRDGFHFDLFRADSFERSIVNNGMNNGISSIHPRSLYDISHVVHWNLL